MAHSTNLSASCSALDVASGSPSCKLPTVIGKCEMEAALDAASGLKCDLKYAFTYAPVLLVRGFFTSMHMVHNLPAWRYHELSHLISTISYSPRN